MFSRGVRLYVRTLRSGPGRSLNLIEHFLVFWPDLISINFGDFGIFITSGVKKKFFQSAKIVEEDFNYCQNSSFINEREIGIVLQFSRLFQNGFYFIKVNKGRRWLIIRPKFYNISTTCRELGRSINNSGYKGSFGMRGIEFKNSKRGERNF